MARLRRHWYEREEAKKVNLDWVKTHVRLTKREEELLRIIYDRKLVRRDMLEIISPSYRNIGDSRTRVMNRSIRKMFESMCIDKVHEESKYREGNSPAIIAIDKAGSLILGESHKPRIKHIDSGGYIKRMLPINFRHINGVNQLEVETILLCESTGNELIEWVHEKPQELYYAQEKITIIPDVAMQLKLNGKPFYAFVEYDTGAENLRYKEPPIIKDKIIKYRRYKASSLWQNEYPYFPMVLLVTEDEKRVKFFTDKCKENGIRGFGVYYENYVKFLRHLTTMV